MPLSVFKKPESEAEYSQLNTLLELLIDEIREDEEHPLALATQIISENLECHGDEHYPAIGANVSDIDMVKYLM